MPTKNPVSLEADKPAAEDSRRPHGKSKGQALLIVALMMSLLIMFVGLAVDAGNLMGRRAKLQSAVDASALSAAQMLVASQPVSATVKADQMIEANGIPARSLARVSVSYPATNQVHIEAEQRVDTFFMRIVPAWDTVIVSVEATVDINSYAEMNTKPFGYPGVVSELNLMVWGVDSWRRGGDAYSPRYIGNSGGVPTPNPLYSKQPYGYLYRVDVPANYANDILTLEIFDPDSYNRQGAPPTFPPPPSPGTPTPTVLPDMFASCDSRHPFPGGVCTSSDADYNPGMRLLAFPNQRDARNRTAFWRVDEYRTRYSDSRGITGEYLPANATQTQYTLYHFDTHITSAFGDPAVLSDYSSGGNPWVARYTVRDDPSTDLRWYQPPGFSVRLKGAGCPGGGDCIERESAPSGGWYFYLYVQGIAGSSENNFDMRVGPPQTVSCSDRTQRWCYINNLYYDQYALPAAQKPPDWNDGGVRILAKRALPLNLDAGDSFPLAFTQVSKNAAGQSLGIRHFDQDCDAPCSRTMNYQMQLCVNNSPCPNLLDPSCWGNVGAGNTGRMGPNDGWANPGNPDPDRVRIPLEGSPDYIRFFGSSGQCTTSWLRIESNPSYSQDTTVWEMPFLRPRLIK